MSAGAVLAIGAAIALYAYRDTLEGLDLAHEKSEEARLYPFDPGEVTRGTVTTKSGSVDIEWTGQRWRITSPIETGGDGAVIEQMIASISTLRTTSRIDGDDAKYGLDEPSVRVVLIMNGKEAELRVGLKNEFDGRYYVQNPARKRIGLADKGFVQAVDRDLFALRDKRLLALGEVDVLSVEVARRGAPLYRLERKDGAWILDGKTEADTLETERLIDVITDVRAKRYPDDSGTTDPVILARYGLEPPGFTVTIGLTLDRKLVLRVGGALEEGAQRWFAKVDGLRPIAEVRASLVQDLDRTAADFEDRRVLDFRPADVSSIRVRREAESFAIDRRDAGAWAIDGAPAKESQVSAFLFALGELRAKRFDTTKPGPADLRVRGMTEPGAEIELAGAKGQTLATLLIGRAIPRDPTERFVMAKGGPHIDVVDATHIQIPARAELLEPASPDAGQP